MIQIFIYCIIKYKYCGITIDTLSVHSYTIKYEINIFIYVFIYYYIGTIQE